MPSRPQIINHMLRVLGEGGASYDMSLHPTVQLCNGTLDTVAEEVLGKGWWFNKEYGLRLVPDNRGEIIVPPDALDISLHAVSNMNVREKSRYVRRDNRLYDTYEHTYTLNRDILVDTIMKQEINDLPSVMQTYIQHKAAETVFLDEDGDVQKLSKLEQRTAFAWQALQAAQLKNLATNALDGTFARSLQSGWRGSGGGTNPNYIGGRLR